MNKQSKLSRSFDIVRLLVVVSLLAGMLWVQSTGVAHAAPIVIDHFDVTQSITQTGVGTSAVTAVSDLNIIGSSRWMSVTVTTGGGALTSDSNVSFPGKLSHSAGSGVFGITQITYDGSNGSGGLQPSGLGSVDLTDGGANSALVLELTSDDFAADITVWLYQGTTCSRLTIRTPGGIPTGNMPVAFVFRYTNFSPTGTGCSGATSASNVGAIRIVINSRYADSTDLTVHQIESAPLDYGDLPSTTYNFITLYTPGSTTLKGAGHVLTSGLNIGANIDSESNGQPTPAAFGDDPNGTPDDEDGLVRDASDVTSWTANSAGHQLNVTTTGTGCVSLWIDWNNDGDLSAPEDAILVQQAVTGAGTVTNIPITVPDGTIIGSATNFFARVRLFSRFPNGTCDNDTATQVLPFNDQFVGGEVEDHRLLDGTPTAVTLTNLEATADAQNNTAVVILAASVVAALGLAGVVMARRRRTA